MAYHQQKTLSNYKYTQGQAGVRAYGILSQKFNAGKIRQNVLYMFS